MRNERIERNNKEITYLEKENERLKEPEIEKIGKN